MSVLAAGDVIPPLTLRVELGAMKVLSVIMRDPNPIHYDPEHTKRLGMGDKPINQGTLTMGYPLNALLAVIGDPARIRRYKCRFQGSVVADDVVTAGGEVVAVDDNGEATVSLWLDKGRERVLTGTARVAP